MTEPRTLDELEGHRPSPGATSARHPTTQAEMLAALGLASLDELIDRVVPAVDPGGRAAASCPPPGAEAEALARLRELAGRNRCITSLIGMGYSDTITPAVILRNVLENPAWYTAYTPYQPEISQGRLEALLNFQTMVVRPDRHGAGQRLAARRGHRRGRGHGHVPPRSTPKAGAVFVVDADCHPQTIAVVAHPGRAARASRWSWRDPAPPTARGRRFGVLLPVPGLERGASATTPALIEAAHDAGALVTVAADLLGARAAAPAGRDRRRRGGRLVAALRRAARLRRAPRRLHRHPRRPQAHAARSPGRRVGRRRRAPGLPPHAADPRAAHPPREGHQQHLHRPGAAGRHGRPVRRLPRPRRASRRIADAGPPPHRHPGRRPAPARASTWCTDVFFDTLTVRVPGRADAVLAAARGAWASTCAASTPTPSGSRLDETTTRDVVEAVWAAFGRRRPRSTSSTLAVDPADVPPRAWRRTSAVPDPPGLPPHHSETAMLRYLRRLADRDLALDRTMIPLGSCTMKLNATTEMIPVTWPEFGSHPPLRPGRPGRRLPRAHRRARGGAGRDHRLRRRVAAAQRRVAGRVRRAAGHPGATTAAAATTHRDVCLIPASAHGTNAASAAMAGLRRRGRGLRRRRQRRRGRPAGQGRRRTPTTSSCLMVTYPSTHGVFEAAITEICDAGPRRTAARSTSTAPTSTPWSGVATPGPLRRRRVAPQPAQDLLHPPRRRRPRRRARSRCARTWRPFLPNHPLVGRGRSRHRHRRRSSAAPWGSAGILPISWAYITLMGARRAAARPPRSPSSTPTTSPGAWPRTTRCSTPARTAWWPTSASSTCGPSPRTTGVTRRRRGQAPHRLRLPRPDHVVPGGRHADDRAHRVRVQGRARPLLRRHDRHPGRDRPGGRRHAGRSTTARCATPPTPPRTCWPTTGTAPYARDAGGLPGGGAAGRQVLPAGRPHRRRLRRPQRVLQLPPMPEASGRQASRRTASPAGPPHSGPISLRRRGEGQGRCDEGELHHRGRGRPRPGWSMATASPIGDVGRHEGQGDAVARARARSCRW